MAGAKHCLMVLFRKWKNSAFYLTSVTTILKECLIRYLEEWDFTDDDLERFSKHDRLESQAISLWKRLAHTGSPPTLN